MSEVRIGISRWLRQAPRMSLRVTVTRRLDRDALRLQRLGHLSGAAQAECIVVAAGADRVGVADHHSLFVGGGLAQLIGDAGDLCLPL